MRSSDITDYKIGGKINSGSSTSGASGTICNYEASALPANMLESADPDSEPRSARIEWRRSGTLPRGITGKGI